MKYLIQIIRYFFVWALAFVFWVLMRTFDQEVVGGPPEIESFWKLIVIYSSLGLISSTITTTFDRFILKRFALLQSFGLTILLGSLGYLIIFFIMIFSAIWLYAHFGERTFEWQLVRGFILSKGAFLLCFYLFLVVFLIHFIREINKKFGPKNLWRMLLGQFYRPREVNRMIMFLDMKSSTTIAEKIGHLKYSRLLQDCFSDLSLVSDYDGEIYQYAGDEAIIIWPVSSRPKNSRILKTFFAYQDKLNKNRNRYMSRYGLVPSFKCGCHVGNVVMAEVGEIKREIAYHGDTINTTARIQEECNNQQAEILISEELHKLLEPENAFEFKFKKTVFLRGKSHEIKLFEVNRAQVKTEHQALAASSLSGTHFKKSF